MQYRELIYFNIIFKPMINNKIILIHTKILGFIFNSYYFNQDLIPINLI